MPKEIEPILPNGEQNADDHELIKQEWIVEGLVVATDKSHPQYVVTNVLAGHDTVYPGEYRYHQLHSPNAPLALSPENFAQYSYQGLVGKRYYRRHTELYHDDPDYLLEANVVVNVGDRIRVTRWSRQIPYEYDVRGSGEATSSTTEYIENVTILETGIDIGAEEDRVLNQKKYIRKNFAGIFRRLERLQLNQGNRLHTDIEALIDWERRGYAGGKDFYRGEFVYGEEPIQDHFVGVKAEPYTPREEAPLGGDIRFTTTGRAFLARDITAGSPSKELALIEEPMIELTAHVWTETVLNPEVDGVHVDFIVDSVRYIGTKDVELSSHYFGSPGHSLHFNTFLAPGDGYDGVEIKSDETDAIFKYKDLVRKLQSQAARIGIEAKRAQKELGEIPTSEIVSVQSQIQELELAGEKALQDIQLIIDEIKARPSDTKFGGARLLVPRSKLDTVRVVIGRRSA